MAHTLRVEGTKATFSSALFRYWDESFSKEYDTLALNTDSALFNVASLLSKPILCPLVKPNHAAGNEVEAQGGREFESFR